MRRRHDLLIDGKAYKQYTARGMLFGQVAEVPATPFAQKRGQGPATLADSLTLSYFGMDSFHGGRGQDKARSPFAFMDSKRMITFIRDRAIPGPKPHTADISQIATGVEYLPGDVTGVRIEGAVTAWGESFVVPGGGLTVTDLEFYMRKSVGAQWTVDFAIYDENGGLPNSKVVGVTTSASDFDSSWGWVKGVVSPTALTPGNTYWKVVEATSILESGTWYEVGADAGAGYSGACAREISAAWQAQAGYDLYFRINDGALLGASVEDAIEFYPSTLDYIYRTLFFAIGKGLYYLDETPEGGRATGGTSTTLQDTNRSFGVDTYNTGYTLYLLSGTGAGQVRDITATADTELTVAVAWNITPDATTRYVVRKDAPQLQTSKTDFSTPVSDMKVFKDKLYVGQGGTAGVSGPAFSFTGASFTTAYASLSPVIAEYWCVHVNADGDLALWRAYDNIINCSTDGTTFGDDIEVGDKQKVITGLEVYAGELFAFKEDGWYLIDLEEWKAERILNFKTQPDRAAFKAHCEYAGEFYAGKGAGIWRYTPGPDMTPVGMDRGAIASDAVMGGGGGGGWGFRPPERTERNLLEALASGWGLPIERQGRVSDLLALTNFMYVAVDAGEQWDRFSSIHAYNRVGYGEIIRADAINKPIRMLHFSPEISPEPRLWWSEGKTIKFAKISDLSDNPYLWDLSEYIEECELETSKYDAGRILHRKPLIVCGVQSENLLAGKREIEVYYEADRSGLWVLWGTMTHSPYQEIYMSASEIGADKTVAGGSTTTVINVDSTTGMLAGEWVRIGTEHRQVLSVVTSAQFTVTLPFTSAPSSGATVYGGWPIVHEVALKFRGTTDDMSIGYALCGFVGGWVPRPPREWSRTVLVEISDDAVEGRSGAQMWQDLVDLADRPEPIVYKDYWGNTHNVFVREPQFKPLAEEGDAIDKHISAGYAVVPMLDVKLA